MRSYHLECLAIPVVLIQGLVGCDVPPAVGAGCDLNDGELAVSEIMANPLDDDGGREWFEIYNTTNDVQLLDRLVIKRLSLADDGSVDFVDHSLRGAGVLKAKSYFVLGNGAVGDGTSATAPIDYSYGAAGESFGALNNTRGGIALECQGRKIDLVWYGVEGGAPVPVEGRSSSFDGGVAPDSFLNDRGDWWCSSNGERFDGVNFGTPGEANDFCGFATCDTGGGVMRDVKPPGVGELVVSELFTNPEGDDAKKEWVEVYNAGSRIVDVNGLFLVITTDTSGPDTFQVADLGCVAVDPGTYAVIGTSLDRGANGNVPVVAATDIRKEIGNSQGTIEVRHGRTVIDRAAFPAPKSGVSSSLDPMKLSAEGNDDPASFCLSITTGLFDGTGTPAVANDLCPGECRDADTVRLAVPATADSLVITEAYPDPTGADNFREWLEVYVATGPVDFNGLSVVNSTDPLSPVTKTVADSNCLSFAQGTYVVIAGENAAAVDQVNVNVTVPGLTLFNSSSTFTSSSITLKLGATVIDSMSYSLRNPPTDPTSVPSGKSYSLKLGVLSASLNDFSTNWCWSTTPHLPFTGLGSPGSANDACP
jgi:hypothetical protein